MAEAAEQSIKPLEGIKVADFGRYIAGPACATLLADYGATVVRAERIGGGEDRWLTPVTSGGDGALYVQLARGKRSLAYSPRTEKGAQITRDLLAWADVAVANMPDAGLAALGLDWDSVRAVNPNCILVSNTAFGAQGPMASRVGFDGLAQAMSGVMDMTGHPGDPTRANAPFVDFCSAALATVGVLTALMAREKVGGQRVQTALLHTAMFVNSGSLVEQAVTQANRVASGNLGQTSGPSDTFRCSDGWILIQVLGPKQWNNWCALVGQEDWLQDPRFATDQDRGDNAEVLVRAMADWCASKTCEEVIAAFSELAIPVSRVLTAEQALRDPQVEAMGMLERTTLPNHSGTWPLVSNPVRLGATPAHPVRPPPRLGQHSEEVLRMLGYDQAAVQELLREGVAMQDGGT